MSQNDDKKPGQDLVKPGQQNLTKPGQNVATVGGREVKGAAAGWVRSAQGLATTTQGEGTVSVIFANDATYSRSGTWEPAQDTFYGILAATDGSTEVNLAYFRGANEFTEFGWTKNAKALAEKMKEVACVGGNTQHRKVLAFARAEAEKRKVHGVIITSDAFEEEAHLPKIMEDAAALKKMGVKVNFLQEGNDPRASHYFKMIADATGGFHEEFKHGDVDNLCGLVKVTFAYISGQTRHMRALLSGPMTPQVQALVGRLKLSGPAPDKSGG